MFAYVRGRFSKHCIRLSWTNVIHLCGICFWFAHDVSAMFERRIGACLRWAHHACARNTYDEMRKTRNSCSSNRWRNISKDEMRFIAFVINMFPSKAGKRSRKAHLSTGSVRRKLNWNIARPFRLHWCKTRAISRPTRHRQFIGGRTFHRLKHSYLRPSLTGRPVSEWPVSCIETTSITFGLLRTATLNPSAYPQRYLVLHATKAARIGQAKD